MPRHVDHKQRRRALADATIRVVARSGIENASLQLVATEAGWSVGSLRHYFPTKDDLLVGALERVANRMEERIVALPRRGPLAQLRAVIDELLPLDDARREE